MTMALLATGFLATGVLATGVLATGVLATGVLATTVPPVEFIWMLPLCAAISIVSSAAHRDNVAEILRHAVKSTVMLVGGLLAFMVTISFVFEWLLP